MYKQMSSFILFCCALTCIKIPDKQQQRYKIPLCDIKSTDCVLYTENHKPLTLQIPGHFDALLTIWNDDDLYYEITTPGPCNQINVNWPSSQTKITLQSCTSKLIPQYLSKIRLFYTHTINRRYLSAGSSLITASKIEFNYKTPTLEYLSRLIFLSLANTAPAFLSRAHTRRFVNSALIAGAVGPWSFVLGLAAVEVAVLISLIYHLSANNNVHFYFPSRNLTPILAHPLHEKLLSPRPDISCQRIRE